MGYGKSYGRDGFWDRVADHLARAVGKEAVVTTHDLKTWPSEYDAVVRGDKTFEVRSELDRDFAVGDVLNLYKWDPLGPGCYLDEGGERCSEGSAAHRRYVVTYVLHGGRFGLPPNLCVIAIRPEATP